MQTGPKAGVRRDVKLKTIRLRKDDLKLVEDLGKKLGVDFTQVMRMGLRKLAEHEGVRSA